MKKIVFCLAVIAIMSAMVACGRTDAESIPESTKQVSSTTSGTTTTTSNQSTSVSTADIEKSSTTTKAVTDNKASDGDKSELKQIVGTWHEENALDAHTLIINIDGTYRLAYRGGGSEYGKIEIENQELADGAATNVWYCFKRDDGTEWESFRYTTREGLSPALVSGFDDTAVVYAFDSESTTTQIDNTLAAVKRFFGNWSCGRCYISIRNNGDKTYTADVKWSSSAAEGSTWTYICTYDEENDALVCNGTGINSHYVYTEEGQGTETEIYNNGSAMFYTDADGNLMWHDYYENVADDMIFLSC